MSGITSMIPNREFKLNELSRLNSSASEIDGSVSFAPIERTQDIINRLKGASNICIVGDSITQLGQDNYSIALSKRLRTLVNTNNIGRITAYSLLSEFHKVTFGNIANWTETIASSTALNGYSIGSSVVNAYITFSSAKSNQTKARIVYIQQSTAISFEVYVNNVLALTVNNAGGTVEETKSELFTINNTKYNDIKCVVKSGLIDISAVDYYESVTSANIHVLATGGRRTSYLTDATITKIHSDYDVIIWALGYNDVSNYWDENTKTQTLARLSTMYSLLQSSQKYFIALNYIWDVTDLTKWHEESLSNFCASYNNGFYLDYASTIVKADGTRADDAYRQTVLREWSDNAHPNKYGDNRLYNYIVNSLGLRITDIDLNNREENIVGNTKSIGSNSGDYFKTNYSYLRGSFNEALGDYSTAFGRSNKVGYHSFANGYLNIDSGTYNVITGYANKISSSYSQVSGIRGNATLIGNTLSSSRTDNKLNQSTTLIRDIKTTNDTETYLRDFEYTATIPTVSNTYINIVGNAFAVSEDGTVYDTFLINCLIKNTAGTNAILVDSSYKLSNTSTSSIVISGGTTISIKAKGVVGKTIRWVAKLDIIVQSIDY